MFGCPATDSVNPLPEDGLIYLATFVLTGEPIHTFQKDISSPSPRFFFGSRGCILALVLMSRSIDLTEDVNKKAWVFCHKCVEGEPSHIQRAKQRERLILPACQCFTGNVRACA